MSILPTITATDIRDEFLAGIKQASVCGPGSKFNDQFILSWVKAGAASVERHLDINLTGEPDALYHEKLDGIEWDMGTWNLKCLANRPVLKIERLVYKLGNNPERAIPNSWPQIASANQGQVVVIPTAETQMIIEQFYMWWHFQRARYIPMTFQMTTKTGFTWPFPGAMSFTAGSKNVAVTLDTGETRTLATILNRQPWLRIDGVVYRVEYVTGTNTLTIDKPAVSNHTGVPYVHAYPEDLRTAVMLAAVIPMLDLMGTSLYGNPGMTSKNLSLDALTQGKGISAGKGFGPYSALINSYTESLKMLLADLWGEYGPINMTFL